MGAEGIGDAAKKIASVVIIGMIALPLAIWKLVDIVIWVFQNVSIAVGQ